MQGIEMSRTLAKELPTRTINVRLPMNVYQGLEDLAKATARTKSFVTLEALSTYLEAQSWQVQDVEAGLTEAGRGEFATDAEVKAVFAKYGA
jgi:RHH-type rel operon transcriptional repressor/antitoxin RelB